MTRRTADQGVLVIEVPDVDTEEVCLSCNGSWGDANSPSGTSRRKRAEAERVQLAVARMAEGAMASGTGMARKEGSRTLVNQFTVPWHWATNMARG